MKKGENGGLPSMQEGRSLNSILSDPRTLDAIYESTKRIMWSVVEYKELQMLYSCAIKEMQTKLDILNLEFKVKNKRNPICSIQTRLKTTESIVNKLARLGLSPTLENLQNHINDIAGVRVICAYKDDIYSLAEALLRQDDIKLVARKDYIEKPKPNGYRSLHLILAIPVFFAEEKKELKVEVQIRTVAMDFWASLEHQLKYKREIPEQDEVSRELTECAEIIAQTDERMLSVRRKIEMGEDKQSEEEMLFDRLGKLDIPTV